MNPPKLFKLLELGVGVREGEVIVPGDVREGLFVSPKCWAISVDLLGQPEACCCRIKKSMGKYIFSS